MLRVRLPTRVTGLSGSIKVTASSFRTLVSRCIARPLGDNFGTADATPAVWTDDISLQMLFPRGFVL
jgi:hypothetical protein